MKSGPEAGSFTIQPITTYLSYASLHQRCALLGSASGNSESQLLSVIGMTLSSS